MTKRTDEINDWMLAEFKTAGFEDTTENRIAGLMGLRDAWNEDEDSSIEKSLYQLALNAELFRLQIRKMFPKLG